MVSSIANTSLPVSLITAVTINFCHRLPYRLSLLSLVEDNNLHTVLPTHRHLPNQYPQEGAQQHTPFLLELLFRNDHNSLYLSFGFLSRNNIGYDLEPNEHTKCKHHKTFKFFISNLANSSYCCIVLTFPNPYSPKSSSKINAFSLSIALL